MCLTGECSNHPLALWDRAPHPFCLLVSDVCLTDAVPSTSPNLTHGRLLRSGGLLETTTLGWKVAGGPLTG